MVTLNLQVGFYRLLSGQVFGFAFRTNLVMLLASFRASHLLAGLRGFQRPTDVSGSRVYKGAPAQLPQTLKRMMLGSCLAM